MTQQGGIELLDDPVAAALLESVNPAELAYNWMDGSPRVVPVWFHRAGGQIVVGSPAKAPKFKALTADPRVALSIDDNQWPHKVLLIRGHATVEMLDDVVPEYALAAVRYFGPEQGPAWAGTLRGKPMGRIAITPSWVGILDFQTRFPSAMTALSGLPGAACPVIPRHNNGPGGTAGADGALLRVACLSVAWCRPALA